MPGTALLPATEVSVAAVARARALDAAVTAIDAPVATAASGSPEADPPSAA